MANKELDATFYRFSEISITDLKNPKNSRKAFVDCTRYLRRKRERRLYHDLGLANIKKEKYIQAVNSFRIAQAINSKGWSSSNDLGVCLYHLNRYEEAIIQFQKAIDFNQYFSQNTRALPYTNWSLVLYLQGKEIEAEKMLAMNQCLIAEAYSYLQERYKVVLCALEKRLPRISDKVEREQVEHLMRGVNWIIERILAQ